MLRLMVLVVCILSSAGCVKFEIKPGSVVSDTVDAGKELYTTLKSKRNGEEKREYSHTLISNDAAFDTDNIKRCKDQINANINASSSKVSKVISESSDINILGDVRKLTCNMIVLVKPI